MFFYLGGMKILYSDFKGGEVKIKVENLDDLWYLNSIIDKGDFVKGQTLRKIKIGAETDRASNIQKKPVFLKIKVENVEFHKYSDILRVSGTIVEGPEDVAHGSHHTFNVEENTVIMIEKEKWLGFQRDKLRDAAEQRTAAVLMCAMDREDAYFAVLKNIGYEILSHIRGEVSKKGQDTVSKDFYVEIIKVLQDYNKKYNPENIIVASPIFWKDELMKALKDQDLKKKISLATCSTCDENSFNEILKRQETQFVLKQNRIAKEMNIVEELFREVAKNGLASYGYKEVEAAVNSGAARMLLVTDEFLQKTRQVGKYTELETLMRTAESIKAEVHIISSEHDGGKKLDGLGGIGAILRYKISD